MTRRLGVMLMAVSLVAAGVPAYGQILAQTPLAQAPPAETKPAEAKPEEKPKTLWEEHVLFAYVESSGVWNMGRSGQGNINNELRFYDNEDRFTFNVGEFSIKKDPSDRYPFGYGLVLTAGIRLAL